MTLALAVAVRASSGLRLLATFTDSRLGIPGAPGQHTDVALKSFGLGPKSAVMIAGSTLPVVTAVEGTRGLIANANALRIAAGMPILSLLEEARQFVSFFGACCRGLAEFDLSTTVVIAGFFADGEPGLIKLCYAGGSFTDDILRPNSGDFAICSIGEKYFAGIATHAIGSLLTVGCTGQALFERVASVFWDVISHAGAPTVGGGIALGMCRPEQSSWQWPIVLLDGQAFYRGLPISRVPDEWSTSTLSLALDPEAFAAAEREQPPDGYATQYPAAITTGKDFACPPDWKLTAAEQAILTGA